MNSPRSIFMSKCCTAVEVPKDFAQIVDLEERHGVALNASPQRRCAPGACRAKSWIMPMHAQVIAKAMIARAAGS